VNSRPHGHVHCMLSAFCYSHWSAHLNLDQISLSGHRGCLCKRIVRIADCFPSARAFTEVFGSISFALNFGDRFRTSPMERLPIRARRLKCPFQRFRMQLHRTDRKPHLGCDEGEGVAAMPVRPWSKQRTSCPMHIVKCGADSMLYGLQWFYTPSACFLMIVSAWIPDCHEGLLPLWAWP